MDRLAIIGGRPLYGEIAISGAKNSALKLMVACLLTDEPLILENVPDLADIRQLKTLLQGFGADISGGDHAHGVVSPAQRDDTPPKDDTAALKLHLAEVTSTLAPYDIVRKMRASFNVLGPLVAREGAGRVSLPGGCAIGARPVDLHLKMLEAMGAEILLDEGYVEARAPSCGLRGAEITFPFVSVGATEHALLTASLARGETRLTNVAREPEISDLIACLQKMGAKIEGAGTSVIHIEGAAKLSGTRHRAMPDRIEAGSYAMAVGTAGGELTLTGASKAVLGAAASSLEAAGLILEDAANGLHIRRDAGQLRAHDIVTQPFPGFPTDLQAQFMAMMATAEGTSTIKETIFENRFMHAPELTRMGASIQIDGQLATIRGRPQLKGAPVMATDLRASKSLVLAALGAEGQTLISRVYHLDRGFERLDRKLRNVGALVERVPEEEDMS